MHAPTDRFGMPTANRIKQIVYAFFCLPIRVKNPRNLAYRHLIIHEYYNKWTSRMMVFAVYRRCQWDSLPADGQTSKKENEA